MSYYYVHILCAYLKRCPDSEHDAGTMSAVTPCDTFLYLFLYANRMNGP
jgi:hypothetical protein